MFYDGSLQNGIVKAVQEQKLVVCFIKGSNDESSEWESSYLQQAKIEEGLESRAIVFRLQEGSQEARFLSAFCPISSAPLLVMIKNGTLHAKLKAGISKEQFTKGLLQALDPGSTPEAAASQPAGSDSQTAASQSPEPDQNRNSASPTPSSTTNARVQAMLEERHRRLETEKAAKDKAEKARRQAIAAAMREEADDAPEGSPQANRAKYARMQRDRERAARDERERVLKSIENDKIERRERDRRGKVDLPTPGLGSSRSEKIPARKPVSADECALKVRMSDGSTLMSRFPATDTIADVRAWIDRESEGDVPYKLKQVLSPLPNREISDLENETLVSLGLTPSATLVQVPIQGYVTAQSGPTGYLSWIFATCYGAASYVVDPVTQFFGRDSQPPKEGDDAQVERSTESGSRATRATARKTMTLHDLSESKDDQQYYNGNSLNFDSKDDDVDD